MKPCSIIHWLNYKTSQKSLHILKYSCVHLVLALSGKLMAKLWGINYFWLKILIFQAYSLVDREVGYCQGSAFIVGLLLMQVCVISSLEISKSWWGGFLCNCKLCSSYANSWINVSSSPMLWSSPVWATAMCSIWSCPWRVYGNSSWFKMQWFAYVGTSQDLHICHIFHGSCIGYLFSSEYNSWCWLHLSLGASYWKDCFLSYLYPAHQSGKASILGVPTSRKVHLVR